ncbi:hypothetical protein Hanom_Chr03g00205711 [Helianthus anomalus]
MMVLMMMNWWCRPMAALAAGATTATTFVVVKLILLLGSLLFQLQFIVVLIWFEYCFRFGLMFSSTRFDSVKPSQLSQLSRFGSAGSGPAAWSDGSV